MNQNANLTAIAARAAASQVLEEGGYQRIESAKGASGDSARIFEDAYGVVALHVFDSFADLLSQWPDKQADLVDLISEHWDRGEAKSWDGYLLLLCPEPASERYADVELIRYDTSRVRKIVGVGEDIQTLDQIGQVLLPLLPINTSGLASDSQNLLDELPSLISDERLSEDAVAQAIEAYRRGSPILEALDAWGRQAR